MSGQYIFVIIYIYFYVRAYLNYIRSILFLYHYMIPFFIRLHFKFTFTFTFLYQKLPVLLLLLLSSHNSFTFLPFYPFTFKLCPDVAPTAWRRNLCRVPTQSSLHRYAFSSSSPRIFILLATLSHPPSHHFSILHFRYIFRFLMLDC